MRETCIFLSASYWNLLLSFLFLWAHWLNCKFPSPFWGSAEPEVVCVTVCPSVCHPPGPRTEGKQPSSLSLPLPKGVPSLLHLCTEQTGWEPEAGGGRSRRWKAAAFSSSTPISFFFFFFLSFWGDESCSHNCKDVFKAENAGGSVLKRQVGPSQPRPGGSGFISLFSFLLPRAVIRNLNLTQNQPSCLLNGGRTQKEENTFFYCFFPIFVCWKRTHVGDSIYFGYSDRLLFFFFFISLSFFSFWIRHVVAEPTSCFSPSEHQGSYRSCPGFVLYQNFHSDAFRIS